MHIWPVSQPTFLGHKKTVIMSVDKGPIIRCFKVLVFHFINFVILLPLSISVFRIGCIVLISENTHLSVYEKYFNDTLTEYIQIATK